MESKLENQTEEKQIIEEEKKQKRTRDVAVDLIRLVACLLVIATHLTLTTYNIYEVQVDWSRLFTKCFVGDGVAIFFLITGFFITNGRKYTKTLKNAFKNIVLPSFLLLLFSEIFKEFITNQMSFMECLKDTNLGDFIMVLNAILHGEVRGIIPVASHLWYIFAYIEIIILFPVLQLLCSKEHKQATLARRILMIVCFINVILKDVQKFFVLPQIGEIHVFTLIDEKLLLVLLGYELFQLKDKISGNKILRIISFLSFIIINVLRYKAEMQYMIIHEIVKEEAFVSWDTVFGILSAISLFIGIYTFQIRKPIVSKCITYLSSMTFGIYLVHYMLIAKIDIFRFEKISTVKFEMLYMVLGTLGIFLASLLILAIIKGVLQCGKKLLKNKENT